MLGIYKTTLTPLFLIYFKKLCVGFSNKTGILRENTGQHQHFLSYLKNPLPFCTEPDIVLILSTEISLNKITFGSADTQ